MKRDLIQTWRSIITEEDKSWVLFENGTCIIMMSPENIQKKAIELMNEWGAVHAGSSAGDFSTIELKANSGWVVTCHHNDILTYVDPEEISSDLPDYVIGLLGRSKREEDAKTLNVIHVETKKKVQVDRKEEKKEKEEKNNVTPLKNTETSNILNSLGFKLILAKIAALFLIVCILMAILDYYNGKLLGSLVIIIITLLSFVIFSSRCCSCNALLFVGLKARSMSPDDFNTKRLCCPKCGAEQNLD